MGSTQDTWRRISQIQNRHNTLLWRDLHFVFFSPVGDFFRWYWGGIGGKNRNSGDILRSWVCLCGCYSPFGLNELKGFAQPPLGTWFPFLCSPLQLLCLHHPDSAEDREQVSRTALRPGVNDGCRWAKCLECIHIRSALFAYTFLLGSGLKDTASCSSCGFPYIGKLPRNVHM